MFDCGSCIVQRQFCVSNTKARVGSVAKQFTCCLLVHTYSSDMDALDFLKLNQLVHMNGVNMKAVEEHRTQNIGAPFVLGGRLLFMHQWRSQRRDLAH
jgi:hypothetical protein